MSVHRHRYDTISIAALILATIGLVQVRAAEAASQELSSIDKVQTWLEDLGVEQSVRDNYMLHAFNVKTLTFSSKSELAELGLTSKGKQIELLARAKQEQEVKKQELSSIDKVQRWLEDWFRLVSKVENELHRTTRELMSTEIRSARIATG